MKNNIILVLTTFLLLEVILVQLIFEQFVFLFYHFIHMK